MEQAFFFFFSLSINTTRILNLTVCSASHTIKNANTLKLTLEGLQHFLFRLDHYRLAKILKTILKQSSALGITFVSFYNL